MSDTLKSPPLPVGAKWARSAGLLEIFTRSRLLAVFSRLEQGQVKLAEGAEMRTFGRLGGLSTTLWVHDPAFYPQAVLGGTVGAGRAYMRGQWSCDDPTALCRIFLQNAQALRSADAGLAKLAAPFRAVAHALKRNTRHGSRRNIQAHYDLGNEFFQLFLDPTLMYSCALFERPGMTLEEAQVARMERICERLQLGADDHLVEIGTGWGGFALHAATHHGCRVTTTTISREQHQLATERVHEAGLQDRVKVLLRDYRDLEGHFDKLVSIEMIEAVGAEYYETYFRKCTELLRPGGTALIQAILIRDDEFDAARDSVDFIKRFIFPGSCIPSLRALRQAMDRSGGLRELQVDDLTPHYAETLRRWRANFFRSREAILALGFDQDFVRMWDFYFCYCEAGFEERHTRDVHLLLERLPGRAPGSNSHGSVA